LDFGLSAAGKRESRVKPHLWLIHLIGILVPRRLRADWRQEWEAELRYREMMLTEWDKLNWKSKADLLRRSLGAFWDALVLQPRRLEDEMFQDLRFAIRTLLKQPVFMLIVVITLSLGIGANTAIFSVISTVLLKPLPYKEPDRIVALSSFNPQKGEERFGVSPADFFDWQAQSQSFENLALYTFGTVSFRDGDHPEEIPAARVSTNFFPTLGVQPIIGRNFTEEEGTLSGPGAIMLSYQTWQRRFGSDPGVVGQIIATGGKASTIVGVMPPDFKFPAYAEVWRSLERDTGEMQYRASRYMQVIGRLKPGESVDAARTEMNGIAAGLATQYPKDNQGWIVYLASLRDHLVRDTRLALLILMGAVGLVLLIACANVANLLLVRAASRRKEMAIRLALGANRLRLMRQLIVESVLLAVIAGACGLLLASWGIKALLALIPEYSVYKFSGEIGIEGTVMGFTLLVSLITGILFGLVPAWQSSRPDVNEWLKESGRSSESRQNRFTRNTLVVAEITLALILLVGAGLLLNSFLRLQRVDLGYDPKGLLTMWISPPKEQYHDTEARAQYFRQMLEEVERVPGVEMVTMTSSIPFGNIGFPFNIEGRPLPDGDANARYSAIAPNYFKVLKTPLLAGREFDARDRAESPIVIVINEALAHHYFAGEDPIGKKLSMNYLGHKVVLEIIGVVSNITQSVGEPVKPEIFVTYSQLPWFSQALVIRTTADIAGIKNAVQRAVWAVDANQPVSKGRTIEEDLRDSVASPRLYAVLLGTFAALALLLAVIGIYGVMAYTVTQRTPEIGIRRALGAPTQAVLKMIIGQGMKLAVIGVAIGVLASWGLTRLLKNLLFGVSATDPLTFVLVAGVLILAALLACYIPARQATRIDPLVALRNE
jgi:putative ABC transport system permease protein